MGEHEQGKYWVECSTCGYDSEEAGFLDREIGSCICPICAGDCGHSNRLSYREATKEEINTIYPKMADVAQSTTNRAS